MQLQSGTLLQGGKYRIIRFINSGGFGCTYEAEHVMLENRVAIKEFFVKDFCNRDETTAHVTVGTQSKKGLVNKLRQKFIDEARAICKLHHPGIVTVSDVFEENGTAYFVMDYIEGRSLSQMVHTDGPLTEGKALYYIRQVADALKYVHEHNRLHLDVKPGNIMVDGAGRAILIDFGASKQYDEQDGENTSTLLGKTPGYAPLEQMGNDVVKFLPSTDIYALGATLYKLLTGVTPLSAHLLASGEELPPLPDTVSPSIRQAVDSAMQQRKKDRPQSIDEFLGMLVGAKGSESFVREVSVEIEDIEIAVEEDVTSEKIQETEETVIHSDSSAQSKETNRINGHEYVDLGLSVKWATCNIGAENPEDFGDYFAWGETKPKKKYSESTYEHCIKKFLSCEYIDIGEDIAGTKFDAARANWGDSWRLPTKSELDELKNKCVWTWTTQGDHGGYEVTGLNGNSIFLPAAGTRDGESVFNVGVLGSFWSANSNKNKRKYACNICIGKGSSSWVYEKSWRSIGENIRPVSD